MKTIVLPYPPSINNYYKRNRNGGLRISDEGKSFRKKVRIIIIQNQIDFGTNLLSIRFDIFPPDNIRRDADNVEKALWDALEKGKAFENDSQIKHKEPVMWTKDSRYIGGAVVLQISVFDYSMVREIKIQG